MGKPEKKLSALDRAILTALGDGRKVGLEDDPARTLYPTVWDWLTRTGDGGEHVMQPGQISIQLGPEGVFATITMRDVGVSLSVACTALGDVLQALETSLSSSNPPIRYWGKTEPRLRKRRPKS